MSEINKSKRQTTRHKVECLACQAICDGKTNETINKESIEIFSANELTILIKKDKLRKRPIANPEESLELKHITVIVPISEYMKVLLTELIGTVTVDEEEPENDEYKT